MAIENSKNKDMASSVEQVEIKKEIEHEFHFSGGGEYFPMTVKASSQERATEVWQQKRVPYKK